MEVKNNTLYMKGSECVCVDRKDIFLKDIVQMECSEKSTLEKIGNICILQVTGDQNQRYVISVLKIIEKIHELEPELEIQNFGPSDYIVKYEVNRQNSKLVQIVKIILVTLITFAGASFSIMTFNNDAGIPTLFSQIYEQVMGEEKSGFTVLEVMYSIGITIGILVFFNHFGKKNAVKDPTPISVEMTLYEKDIYTTLIKEKVRKGNEIDVDSANNTGNSRC